MGEEQSQRSQTQSGGSFSYTDRFDAIRHSRGVFAELITPGPHWSMVLGGRIDDNDAFGTFRTYRVAGRVDVGSGAALRATVGTGYREPSFFESYATGFVRGNPALRPEHSTGWEVGLDQQLLGGRATLGLVHFDQRFRDMIDYDGGAAPTEPSYHNKASATASGQELELSARLPASFRTSFMVTRLRTNVKDPGFNPDPTALLVDGQRLVRRPNWTGSATLSYAHSGGASGEVRVSRMGDRDDRAYVDFSAGGTTGRWSLPLVLRALGDVQVRERLGRCRRHTPEVT
jgi:vitamin B12 transporter